MSHTTGSTKATFWQTLAYKFMKAEYEGHEVLTQVPLWSDEVLPDCG